MPYVIAYAAAYIATTLGASIATATAVGVAAASIVVEVGVSLAVSLAVSEIAKALAGKPGAKGDPPQRLSTTRGTAAYQQLIYGQVRTGGFLAYYNTSGTNNDVLWFVIVVAAHEVTAIDDVWLDARHLTNADFNVGGQCLNAAFNNPSGNPKLSVFKHLGGSTSAVDSTLQAACPEWDSSHIGYGVAYLVFQLARDSVVWPAGAPSNFFALVKGRKLYDPRLDSTNGGSGSHRYTDPSTWAWSQNWALAVRDYLAGGAVMYVSGTADRRKGLGEADARIDDSYIIAAANHADETVTVPLPMIPGTTTWTNSSTAVLGTGTQFTDLTALTDYVVSPGGVVHQIASITDDTHMTVVGAYAGSTSSSNITHYSTSSSATSTTESRFTADCQLSCGNPHSENIAILLSAGNGKLSYSGGKWCLSAGVYVTPTVTLTQDDVLGALTVNTHDTSDQCWNYVDGTFFDENNGWAEMPFPAQQNPTYESDDGRQYPNSIDLQATRGVYRAQRIAQVILQQGRNMLTINASALSQKAFQIKTWDNFYLTIPEYGWTNQVFKCVKWKFLASGLLSIQARSESSSAYADPALGTYVDPATNNPPAFVLDEPNPPGALTTTSVSNGVQLNITLPGYFPASQFIEIWEYSSNSPFSSATLIGTTRSSTYVVSHADTVTRYYWVTTGDVNGGRSTSYPSGAGVAGTPLSSQFWSPQLRGYARIIGGTVYKDPSGTLNSWDSDVTSAIAYPAVTVEGTYSAGGASSIGLATAVGSVLQPGGGGTSGYFAIYAHGDSSQTIAVDGSGNVLWTGGTPVAGDRYLVAYDGFYVDYYVNNTWVASAPLLSANVYIGLALYHNSEVLSNVQVSASIIATPSEWIETGNCVVSGSNAAKVSGSTGWNSSIYSRNGHTTAHVIGKATNLSDSWMLGLTNSNPAASPSYANIAVAWYCDGAGNWEIYQTGSHISTYGAASVTDVVEISYDGSAYHAVINGATAYSVSAAGLTVFGMAAFNNVNAAGGINSLEFGPTTTAGVTDKAQLGANSASLLVSNTASGSVTINPNVSGTALDSDVVSVTATCDGSALGIDISGDAFIGNGSSCHLTSALITIRRDGTDIGTASFDGVAALTNISANLWAGQVTLTVVDTPSAGSHTYTAHMHGQASGTSGSSTVQMTNTAIKVREYYK